MAVIDVLKSVHSIEVRGKLGTPNGLGLITCGLSLCGMYLPVAGIYQKRHAKNGQYFVKMRHYRPTNPRTVNQQNNRISFKNAVLAWQTLDESEKLIWRRKKHPRFMSGYNRFIREYMRGNILKN